MSTPEIDPVTAECREADADIAGEHTEPTFRDQEPLLLVDGVAGEVELEHGFDAGVVGHVPPIGPVNRNSPC